MIEESSPSMKNAPAMVTGTISGTFACGGSSFAPSDSATIQRACFHITRHPRRAVRTHGEGKGGSLPLAMLTPCSAGNDECFAGSMGLTASLRQACGTTRFLGRFEVAQAGLYMIVRNDAAQ